MARASSEQDRSNEINRKFEKQRRRLNRRWLRNALSGVFLLIVAFIILQFTPYRNIHLEIIDIAKNLVEKLSSGPSRPAEPNPKYW